MTIAILATGDEIVQGDTLNTNGFTIAHTLTSEGLSVGLHLSCSDNEQEITAGLEFLYKNHEIIILLGGLGPTSDDRTRFALASFLKKPLEEFAEALEHIQARLTRANLNFDSGNRQQALFPKGANLLPNPLGTAMGCIYQSKNKLFVMLPGPPRECLLMFSEYVLPILRQTEHTDKHLLKWRLFGVAEGAIATILDTALSQVDCITGYRLETPYLEFKVRCRVEDDVLVNQIVEPLVLPHVIASPEQKASERLAKVIEQMQQPIVIIDDVTGGLLETLIHRPGNYRWLTFHERAKSKWYFHLSGLEEYWSQLETQTTTITINYHNDTTQGSESHQIPYRSSLVVDYAAEWLSYRILQLIE